MSAVGELNLDLQGGGSESAKSYYRNASRGRYQKAVFVQGHFGWPARRRGNREYSSETP
jgi:hypothetical protein